MEDELTLAVLSPEESVMDFLDPDLLELEEARELYNMRTITGSHLLNDKESTDLTRYGNILVQGNKIYRENTDDGDSCLYIIKGPKKLLKDGTLSFEAVEAAVELGELPPLRSPNFSWIVNEKFINYICGALFEAGNIDGPVTATVYNGALTPLAILNEIQNDTGGEFQYRYEYDETVGYIRRYIDFHYTIGKTHTDVIEIGWNAQGIELEINDEEVATAAAPTGRPDSDSSTFHQSLKGFEDLEVSTSSQIYLYVTKDDEGNIIYGPTAYPPYNKSMGQNYVACDNETELVASYQTIHISRNAKYKIENPVYSDSFEDGKLTGRSSPYRNWTTRGGSASIVSSGQIEGNYSLKHTGNGSDTANNSVTIADTKTAYTLKVTFQVTSAGSNAMGPYINIFLRYVDANNWLRVETWWDTSTSKRKIKLVKCVSSTVTVIASYDWGSSKLPVGAGVSLIIKDNGSHCTIYQYISTNRYRRLIDTDYTCNVAVTNKGVGANVDTASMFDVIKIEDYSPAYMTEYKRIRPFETSEENKYNIFWECVDTIRNHLVPSVTIECSVADLEKLAGNEGALYNIGDIIPIKIPGYEDEISCRITETVKDPRHPEDIQIKISTYKTSFMQEFYRSFFKNPGIIDIK